MSDRDTVISVERISKLYRLGEVGTGTLTHDLNRWWHRLRGHEDPYTKIADGNEREKKGRSDYVWALQDVSFDVKRGEVLGIVGRNGAGKSTMLKILSRVTLPTKGEVKVRGRIASLLEVGTGFNPELTGRENIYLNGAILGMSKSEIDRKFDQIVEFAGVERYIETPVKRYSSGMYVRLAFAVAAHLEPEILIVDEVLAVGDVEFQKKCLGKMQDVAANEGRTVLFVSHNMEAVSTLTTRSILFEQGRVALAGSTRDVIARYVNESNLSGVYTASSSLAGKAARICSLKVLTSEDSFTHIHGKPAAMELTVECARHLNKPVVAIQIFDAKHSPVVHFWTNSTDLSFGTNPGIYTLRCELPSLRLYKGEYFVTAYLSEDAGRTNLDTLDKACSFRVEMFGIWREYEWQDNVSVYLDEFSWRLSVNDSQ
ncbi:ABC transporter ATP-binding protein [Verrucomicrobiota bacterium sgz303538]